MYVFLIHIYSIGKIFSETFGQVKFKSDDQISEKFPSNKRGISIEKFVILLTMSSPGFIATKILFTLYLNLLHILSRTLISIEIKLINAEHITTPAIT